VLGLTFVGLAAGIVAAGSLYYRNFEKRYLSQVERQLSTVAELKVAELARWRKARLSDGAFFFKNRSFSSSVHRFLEKSHEPLRRAELQDWLSHQLTDSQYDRILLIDTQGVERVSFPETPEPVEPHLAQAAVEALSSGQSAFLDFYRDAPGRPVHLGVLVPILGEPDTGPPLGVLILRIDPAAYLYPYLQRWPTPSSTAETLLVRREGDKVIFLNELRFQKDTALTLRRSLAQKALPAAQAALGQEGVINGIDYRGEQVVAALRAIPNSPWFMVVRMDISEVYAPLREQLRLVEALIIVLLLGAGASVGVVWRQQRVRFLQARYKAQEDRAKLAAIVEFAEDAIIGKSLDGTITSWNPAAERLFGYQAAEMIGQPVTRIIPHDDLAYEPEILKRLQRGESIVSYEGVRIAKDGRPIAVSLTVSPIRDSAGTIIGAAKIARDITERRRAEEALRESERRFSQIFNFSPVATSLSTVREGRYLDVNDAWAKMYERARDDVLGRTVFELNIWVDLERRAALFAKLQERGAVSDFEMELRTKSGRIVQVSWSGVTMVIGGESCLLGSALDITERKQAQDTLRTLNTELEQRVRERTAELEAANKELEAFSYSVSHDLRTPLRAMDGFSMALLEDCAGKLDETAQDHLRRIRAGSQRMAELIDDLLNLSQMGRAEMRCESVNLTVMAEEIGAEFQRLQPERHVKFVVAPALVVHADERMLRVVVNNLLGNAWKFTSRQEQALIDVGAWDQDGQRVFFVRDNGAGFDMAYASRLFGAFQRLHSTHEFEGTGIGLALVQRIIHRHGGRVWAEGAVGQGATIYFTLGKERD
jgi:PAS domain S-box-containing protein